MGVANYTTFAKDNARRFHGTNHIILRREFLGEYYDVRVDYTINPGYIGGSESGAQIEPDVNTTYEVCGVSVKILSDWIALKTDEDFSDEIKDSLE